jgi:hypothetical protein
MVAVAITVRWAAGQEEFNLTRGSNPMRKRSYLALGLCGIALGTAGLAQAATITIGTSINGGSISTRAAGPSPGPVDFNGLIDAQWNLNVVSGVNPNPREFDSNSINTNSTGGSEVLRIYITESDITALSGGINFLSGLTANLVPPGWKTELQTYINPNNAVFGTVDLLATDTFSAIGSTDVVTPFNVTTSPISVTELYTITPNGNHRQGTSNATIDLSAAVPESSTWAMMLVGFIGLGFAGFRSRPRTISIG